MFVTILYTILQIIRNCLIKMNICLVSFIFCRKDYTGQDLNHNELGTRPNQYPRYKWNVRKTLFAYLIVYYYTLLFKICQIKRQVINKWFAHKLSYIRTRLPIYSIVCYVEFIWCFDFRKKFKLVIYSFCCNKNDKQII